jgi:hypothetical protein
VYTLFASYSSSYSLSLPPSPSHWSQSPQPGQNTFHPPALRFCRRKKIFLYVSNRTIHVHFIVSQLAVCLLFCCCCYFECIVYFNINIT